MLVKGVDTPNIEEILDISLSHMKILPRPRLKNLKVDDSVDVTPQELIDE